MVLPLPRASASPPVPAVLLAVFAGGVVGGTLRHLVEVVAPATPGEIPWGILLVNVSGAVALGALLSAWTRRDHVAPLWRPFLATGLLGAFTTWSTFMADTLAILRAAEPALAIGYLVGATALGVLAAALGWRAAAALVPLRRDGGGRGGERRPA